MSLTRFHFDNRPNKIYVTNASPEEFDKIFHEDESKEPEGLIKKLREANFKVTVSEIVSIFCPGG